MEVFSWRRHLRAPPPPLNCCTCANIIAVNNLSHGVYSLHIEVILPLLPIREGVVIEPYHSELAVAPRYDEELIKALYGIKR